MDKNVLNQKIDALFVNDADFQLIFKKTVSKFQKRNAIGVLLVCSLIALIISFSIIVFISNSNNNSIIALYVFIFFSIVSIVFLVLLIVSYCNYKKINISVFDINKAQFSNKKMEKLFFEMIQSSNLKNKIEKFNLSFSEKNFEYYNEKIQFFKQSFQEKLDKTNVLTFEFKGVPCTYFTNKPIETKIKQGKNEVTNYTVYYELYLENTKFDKSFNNIKITKGKLFDKNFQTESIEFNKMYDINVRKDDISEHLK
ncbi:hypothetical protein SLITO_v1c06020 [Spiroplasma litorale]|uniref:Transmembrane protein n=1 Tax=Spiroplasma litorale TaxID=216942 RepID=A0A0K1W228_9MOLU|nr:hypothetical protein [Spiroplasma litorale]AKX34236.1 hypothetical protein SLITO_v1c06020 [Spiroplasma litorale]